MRSTLLSSTPGADISDSISAHCQCSTMPSARLSASEQIMAFPLLSPQWLPLTEGSKLTLLRELAGPSLTACQAIHGKPPVAHKALILAYPKDSQHIQFPPPRKFSFPPAFCSGLGLPIPLPTFWKAFSVLCDPAGSLLSGVVSYSTLNFLLKFLCYVSYSHRLWELRTLPCSAP